MYEHIRALLAGKLSAAQTVAQQAAAARDQVQASLSQQQATLAALQAAASTAQANLNARNVDLSNAEALVIQRASALQAAQIALNQVEQAIENHMDIEPPFHLPGTPGPNPDWLEWNQELQQLEQLRDTRENQRNSASQALAQAQQNRTAAIAAVNAAAAALAQAQNNVTTANAGIAATQQQLAAAQAAATAAQQAADTLAAQVASQVAVLDARTAVLQGKPLDRTAVERVTDAELADLEAAWRHRHDLLDQRLAGQTARTAILAAHGSTVDGVTSLRNQIAGWPDSGRWPALATMVSALDTAIAAGDPTALRNALVGQVPALQAVVGLATTDRNQAQSTLDTAAEALRQHQEMAP